ncbi:HNH endonuclease signature motif containing protein [Sediminivirga luteola]|uniref:HNH endonuclease signature motif containing protein n=1 Tax=Sediminivirga luteola TaxID=1774748 RepID=UPI00166427A5|nr:HNH endonuclease signature motif containing protein [Sediminivirga luteola]MCI2265378.1 HNH endonuclease [Sediminivirga luteola]
MDQERVFGAGAMEGLADEELLTLVSSVAELGRRIDAMLIAAADQVDMRTRMRPGGETITARTGTRSAHELLRRVTRLSGATVGRLLKAARMVRRSPSSTGLEPARYPAVREALADGAIGVDGVLAVAGPLEAARVRANPEAVRHAEAAIAETARGTGAGAEPPAGADALRTMADTWAEFLDPDGAEPSEEVAMRGRGLTLGKLRHGLVPVQGRILPEVASGLSRMMDSILNPRLQAAAERSQTDAIGAAASATARPGGAAACHLGEDAAPEPGAPAASGRQAADDGWDTPVSDDFRSQEQRLHDAFATIVKAAAGSGALPLLGGAPPTLVVTVREEDLRARRGWAHTGDAESGRISVRAAEHTACDGAVERVIHDDAGRVVSVETMGRVFTAVQRRAIAARDGGCVIPGCGVRPEWCEVHHVRAWADGGQTHTDNGVLLCWRHHRTLGTSGWEIRMRGGVPHVRAPGWWDRERRWRPVTSSPVRLINRLEGKIAARSGPDPAKAGVDAANGKAGTWSDPAAVSADGAGERTGARSGPVTASAGGTKAGAVAWSHAAIATAGGSGTMTRPPSDPATMSAVGTMVGARKRSGPAKVNAGGSAKARAGSAPEPGGCAAAPTNVRARECPGAGADRSRVVSSRSGPISAEGP